jgi:hypothetical protein
MGAMQKVLAEMWKAASDEEKVPYEVCACVCAA